MTTATKSATYDVLAAEADRYDEGTDRALRQYRRQLDAMFAADLDVQYPPPVARSADELYRDVMVWVAGVPWDATPHDILHTPRVRTVWAELPERDATLAALVERHRPLGWTPRKPPTEPASSLEVRPDTPTNVVRPQVLAGPAPDGDMPGREAGRYRGPRSTLGHARRAAGAAAARHRPPDAAGARPGGRPR